MQPRFQRQGLLLWSGTLIPTNQPATFLLNYKKKKCAMRAYVPFLCVVIVIQLLNISYRAMLWNGAGLTKLVVTAIGMREFCQCCLQGNLSLSFHIQPSSCTFSFKMMRSCRNKASCWFDSVKRKQAYSCLTQGRKAVQCREHRVFIWGVNRTESPRGVLNAAHVWEVVLARFEINDLNMCFR